MADSPSQTRAVVFDLDGTLADSVTLIEESMVSSLTPHLDDIDRGVVRSYIGQPLEIALSDMTGFPLDDERIAQMREHYRLSYFPGVEAAGEELLLPGVIEMLTELRQRGYAIAVVTAKRTDSAEHLLDSIGIRDLVDVLVGTDQVANGKPAPDSALLAMEKLGADVGQTWYVGDATSDMVMALAAGMRPMGVTTGVATASELAGAGALAVAEDASHIVELVTAG